MSNHISHASLPFPVKNARYTVLVPFLDADGDPTDPTTPDTEISQDGGAFTDAAEEVTTISGSNGMGYVTITGAEMNNSAVGVCFKIASGPKATLMTLYPRVLPILLSGTASAGANGSITLAAGAYDLTGCIVRTTGGTGGGGTGGANNQARMITAYSSLVATVVPNWETNPDNTTTYDILLTDLAANTVITRGLRPATDGRTVVIDASGLADANMVKGGPTGSGIAVNANTITHLNTIYDTDYATVYDTTNKAFLAKLGNFAMGGSSLALTTGAIACTTITASGAVAFQSTFAVTTSTSLGALSCTTLTASGAVAFQSTFATTGTTTFNAFTVTNNLLVSGTTTLTGAVTASNASNNIVGIDVAKLSGDATAADNAESFFDGTGYAGTNNVIPHVTLVDTLTTYTGNTPQTGDAYAIVNSGTFGNAAIKGYVDDIGIAGAGLTALGDTRIANLDATVSSRMATYAQPSGFLAATFPGTVASPTNITAATGVILAASGLDAVLVESSIIAGASLTDDATTQLTSINARQAMSLIVSATAGGVLAGAATSNITMKPAGKPSGNTRISATVDADGNRSALTLKVPT